MRTTLSIFAALLLATVSLADANPEPVPCSDHPGVKHSDPSYNKPATPRPPLTFNSGKPSKKNLPKVSNPSAQSLKNGAQNAISQFVNSGYLPSGASAALSNGAFAIPASVANLIETASSHSLSPIAMVAAVNAQVVASPSISTRTVTSTVTATSTKLSISTSISRTTSVSTSTKVVTSTARGTTVTSTQIQTTTLPVTVIVPVTQTQYVTQTQVVTTTSTAPAPTSTTATDAASINIAAAITSAFSAVDLSQSGLDNTTVAALQACLATVLAQGGLPAGYACLSASGSSGTGLQTTLNTILEQFVGILPNVILTQVFDAVSPTLTALLPASEDALVAQIEASIASVIASAAGNSVTALEQVSNCYTSAIQQNGNTSSLACFSSTAANSLQAATNGVIEQFVGVLPASLVTQVENIVAFNLANTTSAGGNSSLAASVQAQISNALNSAGSTLSGNTVTLAETLQTCTTLLISTGDASAASSCITNGTAPVISETIIDGIAEQFEGYLPSSFFTDLVNAAAPFIANSTMDEGVIDAALNSFFNSARYGPTYTTCILQVQACVTGAVAASGTINAICPGPVTGCSSTSSSKKRELAETMATHARFIRRHKKIAK